MTGVQTCALPISMALKPSGELGRDNHVVYGEWLGLSDAEIAQLAREEVI